MNNFLLFLKKKMLGHLRAISLFYLKSRPFVAYVMGIGTGIIWSKTSEKTIQNSWRV